MKVDHKITEKFLYATSPIFVC